MTQRRIVLAGLTLAAAVTAFSIPALLPARAADNAPKTGPLKIGVSAGPYGEIVEKTAELAKKEGIEAEVVEFTDWNLPDEALDKGDLDANNFQHQPYLDNQIAQHGYKIQSVAKSVVVPMGIYSDKVKALTEVPDGATVAIPNDPTNGARGLLLLQEAGLLKLKPGADIAATPDDVVENPHKLDIQELDAAQQVRALPDVTLSVITLNYAVAGGLDPLGALYREQANSRWTLVWAARPDNKDDPRLKRFIELYRSEPIKQFIETRYKGAILATW